MKQMNPSIVNGKLSYNDTFQNVEAPVRRKRMPALKRKMHSAISLNGAGRFVCGHHHRG